MRVGLFTDTFPPDVNGVANSTRILYEELRKNGHEAFVVAPYSGVGGAKWDETHTIMRLAGVTLKQLYGYTMTSPIHIFAMNEVKKMNLDIIHDQTEFGVGIFAHICAKQLGIPLVSTYHTTYEDYTHYVNLLNSDKFDDEAKKAVAYMTRVYGDACLEVIAPSIKTKDLLERYHVHADIRIVPTGLQLDEFDPIRGTAEKKHEIRSRYGIADDDNLIIYVGRIAEEKSLDLVIRGFKSAHDKGCRSKLLIVGGGPDQTKLENLASSLGLNGIVIFAGKRPSEEMPDYYHSADAFVSASLSETQGMTFIEAMASGLPLFARYDRVLDDILIPDSTGWFFEQEDDFADKLMHFEKIGPNVHQKIKQNCLEQVHPYSSEVFYDRAIQVYKDALHLYQNMQIIDDAVAIYNEMTTFADAGIAAGA
ncbi:MAG: glycosyltransferase [Erysipelotrichia bacterium]|nr:glycosyltransferase [Erysipelotrichia bacterium]